MPDSTPPPQQVVLTLQVPVLTRAQWRVLEQAGCTCTIIEARRSELAYQVTFLPQTQRQLLPPPADRRRVNRTYRITLPSGLELEEIALPSGESVLLFPAPPPRTPVDGLPHPFPDPTSERRRPS